MRKDLDVKVIDCTNCDSVGIQNIMKNRIRLKVPPLEYRQVVDEFLKSPNISYTQKILMYCGKEYDMAYKVFQKGLDEADRFKLGYRYEIDFTTIGMLVWVLIADKYGIKVPEKDQERFNDERVRNFSRTLLVSDTTEFFEEEFEVSLLEMVNEFSWLDQLLRKMFIQYNKNAKIMHLKMYDLFNYYYNKIRAEFISSISKLNTVKPRSFDTTIVYLNSSEQYLAFRIKIKEFYLDLDFKRISIKSLIPYKFKRELEEAKCSIG